MSYEATYSVTRIPPSGPPLALTSLSSWRLVLKHKSLVYGKHKCLIHDIVTSLSEL